ncbi:YncE family protein [Flavobacterium aquatile]|uniref:Cell surface protein n=1 Tax=Flavobacterium aquatile LMG 4008 = ATCC 11947 TaxID=1453498 RepID=A0A095SYB7_9FLAO|nr:DUF5074 domain-containing protein [Flavobacterium aquatile]KGD69686.1 hypothetical protein LG45_02710 [Flavobacterium aquatile LMG 4008 = ATCC 11947]OXA67177.1 hypothetical protein B0A61_08180 [Flavobacterium aquatile LMG 4008 = ATCC 11947]GEC77832.1 hypothetical protein FAQ01_07020 [Flavobacterium aquatile]
MKFSKLVFVALVSSIFLTSCSDDDDNNETPLGSYDNGVLILNQGGFGNGNATISYISEDFVTHQNDIFSIVNPTITLGDTAQDIGLYQDLAFVVLNYSNKIEVVNRYTMTHVATISTGLSNPRYIAFSNGKGFVTNWGDGGSTSDDFVAVLNLSTYAVSSTISVAEGPERIVEENNKLYVAHAGGYGYGNTISVINGSTNTLSTTINVGDVPNSLEVENGSLYVICGGNPSYAPTETAGSLVKINLSNNSVSNTISFPAATHPSNLAIEDDKVFYTIDDAIFSKGLNETTLPTTPLFTTTAQGVYGVYSFAVENDKIYVGDAADYSSNGKVYIYSSTGTLEHQYTVGVIPAGFYFNN